jgi:hypothetical protein
VGVIAPAFTKGGLQFGVVNRHFSALKISHNRNKWNDDENLLVEKSWGWQLNCSGGYNDESTFVIAAGFISSSRHIIMMSHGFIAALS